MKAILTYHSVDTSGSVISISPAVFERHVRWLASGYVRVVGLDALLTMPDGTDAVALTFDDAYVNFAVDAWPRLRKHNLPVTLFVPTARVGRANSWTALPGGGMPPLAILDWPELNRLQDEGVTLGAHSRTHPDLRRLDKQGVLDEIVGSLEDVGRETGRRPDAFAFPYGLFDDRAVEAVRTSCRWACTTALRPLAGSERPHLLPRLDAYYLQGPGRLENFGSVVFEQYMRVRSHMRAVRSGLFSSR
jgi:peptidoglycan/xylan/chitin deacetylase (PgdA/CDA1 family)